MTDKREVVITGTGVVSPIGIGKQRFWQSLMAGHSGVERLRHFDPTGLPVPIGAELKFFEPKEFVTPRKSLKVMCREIQTGFAAARLAIDDAHLPPGTVDPDRMGVVFGSDMLYCDLDDMADAMRAATNGDGEVELEAWGQVGLPRLYPLWLLMYLPNMAACHLAISHDARGPTNSITAADASSLLAFIEAVRYLERGLADVMLTGGAGTRLNATQLVYRSDSNLSHRVEEPAAASRPFDVGRDGQVNGEGAAAFVLETREHAEARGATIQARVLGTGQGFEAKFLGGDHYPQPSPEGWGLRHAIEAALHESGLGPDQIGHVNAHGESTLDGDVREAAAIRATLGDVPVTAPKSFFGNLGAGSGAVELAASVLALQHAVIPYTLNYQYPDPACPIHLVRDAPQDSRVGTALALSQSSLGQAAAVLIGT